jgi:hypothetical protein
MPKKYGSFFSSKASYDQSAFESYAEFTHLAELVEGLRSQTKKLASRATKKGAQSPDEVKSQILGRLLSEMDAKIKVFNDDPIEKCGRDDNEENKTSVRASELTAMSNLAQDLKGIVSRVANSAEDMQKLGVKCDSRRENASTAITTGVYTVLIGGATVATSGAAFFPAMALAWFAGKKANQTIDANTDLNKKQTKSELLMADLVSTLNELSINLPTKLMGMNLTLVKNAR